MPLQFAFPLKLRPRPSDEGRRGSRGEPTNPESEPVGRGATPRLNVSRLRSRQRGIPGGVSEEAAPARAVRTMLRRPAWHAAQLALR